jgi:hypothetical protein
VTRELTNGTAPAQIRAISMGSRRRWREVVLLAVVLAVWCDVVGCSDDTADAPVAPVATRAQDRIKRKTLGPPAALTGGGARVEGGVGVGNGGEEEEVGAAAEQTAPRPAGSGSWREMAAARLGLRLGPSRIHKTKSQN